MPKRKNEKSSDYEYVGTARKDANRDAEFASEAVPNPAAKKSEPKAKPKGQC